MNKILEKWNDKYSSQELVFGTTPNEFLTLQASRLKKGASLFCPGDGEGRNGLWLAEQGFTVLSIDGASNATRKASAIAETLNLSERFTAQTADLLLWDWPKETFDGVCCLHVYFMPDERKIINQAMMDSLKTGGLLIMEVFHPDNVGRGCGGPQQPELCYTATDLENGFAGYQVLYLEETEREIRPSSFHAGGFGKVSRCVIQKG